MKKTSLLVASALLASSALFAQDSVTSNVVGYVTLNIKGTGGSGSEAYNYIGVPLNNAADYNGAVAIFSISHGSIQVQSASWIDNQFAGTHYALITSGPYEGISSTITSNNHNGWFNTAEDLTSIISGDESISIHRYNTLADIFGASNESGLQGSSSASGADNILVQTASGFDTYYYKNAGFLGGTGWRSSASPVTDASATPIPYGSGIIVVRKQSSDLDVVVSGSVFSGDATTPIEEGYNWKTSSIPVTLTLADYFGAANEAGLTGSSSASGADNILVFNASGGYDTYYYKNAGFLGGTGWRSSASPATDESSRIISEPGQMFIVVRKSGGAFNLNETSPL
jgi:hypothetical protein